MRELRINLPNMLWDKFAGQTPQQMKIAIATVICVQFHVDPEPKKRKTVSSEMLHRGNGGRFEKKIIFAELQLPDHQNTDVKATAHCDLNITIEPETPRENAAQRPETPLEMSGQNRDALRENTVQQPEIPRENELKRQVSQPITLLETKSDVTRSLKLHPAYASGLKP